MRHAKPWIILTAVLLCAMLTAVAFAENSALSRLWDSGCDLLFHTDNVTVTGEAVFSLDGEYFKTARLRYVQDGYSSLYDLTLLTPRPEQHERQTGWTIIADEEGFYYVMEDNCPGTYRPGSGTPHNSLLRSSVQLDALTELGGLLVGQVEPMLPEGAVTVTEQEGAAQVHIALSGEDIPDMAVSALNLAAEYLSNRWFSFGFDRTVVESDTIAFENYVTVTKALTDGTVRWTLKGIEADMTLDQEGRLTGGKGSLKAESTFWDGTVREVAVQFDFSVTDYGESHVKPFSAEEYGVTLAQYDYGYSESEYDIPELTDGEMDAFLALAKETMIAQGYEIGEENTASGWCDPYGVNISVVNADNIEFYCAYAEDGNLLSLQDWSPVEVSDSLDLDTVADETVAAAREKLAAFLKEYYPAMADHVGELTLLEVLTDTDGRRYLTLADEEFVAYFIVRVEPSWRVMYYAGQQIE